MHGKRRQILDILKTKGSATVEELRQELRITSVTVRHHLDILRAEGLVNEPVARRRSCPGRPQYEYSLTEKAEEHFPKSYARLAAHLMDELKIHFENGAVNVIFEGVSQRFVAEVTHPDPDAPIEERLAGVVCSLNEKGYVARWEACHDGLLLYTSNCPYEGLAGEHPELCHMDLGVISSMVGVPVERICHLASGDDSCSYLIRSDDVTAA